jgi:Cu/Ag efflux protein CusF
MTLNIRIVSAAAVLAALVIVPAAARAQSPVTVGEAITETFTIEAIDSATRTVTLKDKDGYLEDVVCGPEVQRFDALKVGQSVTFRYYESLVTALKRADAAAKPSSSAGVTRTPGKLPGGTLAQQFTTTVTIEAIDPKVPSVTIRKPNGARSSFRVQDPKNLQGFKAGDTVEVTYTQALAVSVTPPK